MNRMSAIPEAQGPVRPPWAMSPDAWPFLGVTEAWMDIGSDIWTFWANRLHADVETEHALLHCTNPVDAQVVMMRHMHKAMDDYRQEAARLVHLLHTVPGAAAVLDE